MAARMLSDEAAEVRTAYSRSSAQWRYWPPARWVAQERGGGTLAGLIALDHDHSRTLLHGTALLHAREGGNLKYANLNIGHSAVGSRHLRGAKPAEEVAPTKAISSPVFMSSER